jgi:hypothetical protein
MPVPWIKSVRDSHELTIFATDTVRNGPWNNVFKNAIVEFNRLSSSMQLGVKFRQIGEPPDISAVTKGANVQFEAAVGTVHEVTLRNKFGEVFGQFTENVSGTEVHGLTMPQVWQNDKGVEEQFRAYIYVPKTPEFLVGPAGQQRKREVGDGVKLFIAVHEMVHACGLSRGPNFGPKTEHSPETDPDLFVGQPQPSPGSEAKDDKLRIRLDPLIKLPKDPPDPPLFLSTRTANMIKSIW